jgi:hypothetical protein
MIKPPELESDKGRDIWDTMTSSRKSGRRWSGN